MKFCCIFLIAMVIFSCQPKGESTTEQSNLRVRSVLESFHDPVGKTNALEYSPEVSEDTFITELLFNKQGQLMKESKFNSKGNSEQKIVFKYDGHGNIIQQDLYSSNGTLSNKITSQYDFENKLIERNEVDGKQQLNSKQTVKLDSNRNRMVTTYKMINGGLSKILENVFDKKNQNILNNYFMKESKEITMYNYNGQRIRVTYTLFSAGTVDTIESAFDKDHLTIESNRTNEQLKSSDQHSYDSKGNRIETVQYFPLTNKSIITRYTYTKNNMEVVTLTGNLMISSKRKVLYDAKHNVVESFRYGIGGRLEEHQRHLYEYDQVGNWTTHKTIINNKSISVALRQIEYF